ncbi:flavin reductase [Streptomyces sp. AJS327]|uniref:flavin reductase family protein n=1 Tax=Streptomyces sp. AJS327 TaxID=2545265 RepID=UPI0015DD6183|nr:flavin reductase family protein [Streptomyces sp. AJS327]MBA0052404.1 flavin reductase [Streptomyces sp. AJS327]
MSSSGIDDEGEERSALFRDAFAQWPSGVAVISAMTADGPVGMTGTAVSSLSLDPLLVMACLARSSSTLAHVRAEGAFGVSLLRRQDRAVAVACSGGVAKERRFVGVPHDVRNGVPVLRHALAWITCEVRETYPGGDHLIVVGGVTGVGGSSGDPLVWHEREFRSL